MKPKINFKYFFTLVFILILACDFQFTCIGAGNYGNISIYNIKVPSNPFEYNNEDVEVFKEISATQGLGAKYESDSLDCGGGKEISKEDRSYNWVNTGININNTDDKIIINVHGMANFCQATGSDSQCYNSITKLLTYPVGAYEAITTGLHDPLASEYWQPKINKTSGDAQCSSITGQFNSYYKVDKSTDLIIKLDLPLSYYVTDETISKKAIESYNALPENTKDNIIDKENFINLIKLKLGRENSYALGDNDTENLRDQALQISGACKIDRIRGAKTFEPRDNYKMPDVDMVNKIQSLSGWKHSSSADFNMEIGLFDSKYFGLQIPGIVMEEGSVIPSKVLELNSDKFIKNPESVDDFKAIYGSNIDINIKSIECNYANQHSPNIDLEAELQLLGIDLVENIGLSSESNYPKNRKYIEISGKAASIIDAKNHDYCKKDVYFYKGSEELTGFLRYKLSDIQDAFENGKYFCCSFPDEDDVDSTQIYGIDFTNPDYNDSDRYIKPRSDSIDQHYNVEENSCNCRCSDHFGTRDGCLENKPRYGYGCYKTSFVGGSQSCGALPTRCETAVSQWRNLRWRGHIQYFSENFDNYGSLNINAGVRKSCTLGHEALEFRIGSSKEIDSFKTLESNEYRGTAWNNYRGTLYVRVVDQEILLKKQELGINHGECDWVNKKEELKKLYDNNFGNYTVSVTVIEDYRDNIMQIKDILFDKFDEIFSLDFRKTYYQNLVGRTVIEITDEVNNKYDAVRESDKSEIEANYEQRINDLKDSYGMDEFNYDELEEQQKTEYNTRVDAINADKAVEKNNLDLRIDEEVANEIDFRLANNDPTLQRLIKIVVTLYIVFTAIGFLLGAVQLNQTDLLIKIIKIGFIYTMLNPGSWEFFNMFFDVFENGAAELSMTITKTFMGVVSEEGFTPIDAIYSKIDELIFMFFQPEIHWKISAIIFSPFIVGLVMVAMLYYAFFLVLYAIAKSIFIYLVIKIMLTILFMVGPIFIIFILFQRTKGMFDSWLNMLISYSFQIIFLFITIAFFSALIYDVFYQLFYYPVCWDKVWSIKIGQLSEINLLYFWKFQMADPKYGDVYNASLGPDFTSMLFFLTLGYIFKQMIDKVTDLGDKISGEGGIGAGSLAQNMMQDAFKTAGQAFGFARKKIAQPIIGRALYGGMKISSRAVRGTISGVATLGSAAVNTAVNRDKGNEAANSIKNKISDAKYAIKHARRNPVDTLKSALNALDKAEEGYQNTTFKSSIGANKVNFGKGKQFSEEVSKVKRKTINSVMSEIKSKAISDKKSKSMLKESLRKNLKKIGVSDAKLDENIAKNSLSKIEKRFGKLRNENKEKIIGELNKELKRKMKALGYDKDCKFEEIDISNIDMSDISKAREEISSLYKEQIRMKYQGNIAKFMFNNPFESDLDRAVRAEDRYIEDRLNSIEYNKYDIKKSENKINSYNIELQTKIKKYKSLSGNLDKQLEEINRNGEVTDGQKEQFNKKNKLLLLELKNLRKEITNLNKNLQEEEKIKLKKELEKDFRNEKLRKKYSELEEKARKAKEEGYIYKESEEKIQSYENERKSKFSEYEGQLINDMLNDQRISGIFERDYDEFKEKMIQEIGKANNFNELCNVYDEMIEEIAEKGVDKEVARQEIILGEDFDKYELLLEQDRDKNIQTNPNELSSLDNELRDPNLGSDETDSGFIDDDNEDATQSQESSEQKRELVEQTQRSRSLLALINEKKSALNKLQEELRVANDRRQINKIKGRISQLETEISRLNAELTAERSRNL